MNKTEMNLTNHCAHGHAHEKQLEKKTREVPTP